MAEKHYVFLKDNRVENTCVFEFEDEQLAIRIAQEQGYDKYIWLDEATIPARWSTYNGTTFTEPTPQYLYSIGILSVDPDAPAPTE